MITVRLNINTPLNMFDTSFDQIDERIEQLEDRMFINTNNYIMIMLLL